MQNLKKEFSTASKSGGGFTLLEITVVVSIIILLGTIFIVNYRGGEKQFALQRSAHKLSQDLRRAQEMAMSAQIFEDTFPKGGYGISLQEGSNSYILFADCNGDGVYSLAGSAATCDLSTPANPFYKGEKIEEIFLEDRISIFQLSPSAVDKSLSVTFYPPDPKTTITPQSSSASIVLTIDGQTRTVSINSVGLIDVY